jgi:hypothetical protein
MRILFVVAPALLFAGTAVAQSAERLDPRDPRAKAPSVEFRSAFEGYRPYVETELRDWRKSNAEVGTAGGHAGHRPGQGEGAQTSKPQPRTPDSAGAPAEKSKPAPAHQGHGGHK